MKIAIIILNWNNASDTLECLASLGKIEDPDFEVLIVDNGSTDDSVQIIQSQYPQHTLIENGENLGFAEGNNRGLREGIKRGAKLLMLLNNDTVVAPDFLSEIVKATHAHPDVGAFGPKIFYYDEPATIWYAGGSVDAKSGRCYHVGCGSPAGHKEETLTDYICGCALVVRAEVLEKVGYLSPEFFLIWEEVDWCYRMRTVGYQCLFVPKAKIWHKVSASFIEGNRGPMWNYYYFRNRLLFHKRHSTKGIGLGMPEFWGLIKKSIHPKGKAERAALLGITDSLLGRFGKGRLNKFIQN